jgi:hypothetical protein
VHTGEQPYSCDVCQKSYGHFSALSSHNKTAAHIQRMKSRKTNLPLNQPSFVDCGEPIKEEDIKEEIKKEESVDDPLTIHQKITNRNVSEYIKEELKEGVENVEDPLSIHQKVEIRDVKEEIKEEESLEDTLTNKQEIGKQ